MRASDWLSHLKNDLNSTPGAKSKSISKNIKINIRNNLKNNANTSNSMLSSAPKGPAQKAPIFSRTSYLKF